MPYFGAQAYTGSNDSGDTMASSSIRRTCISLGKYDNAIRCHTALKSKAENNPFWGTPVTMETSQDLPEIFRPGHSEELADTRGSHGDSRGHPAFAPGVRLGNPCCVLGAAEDLLISWFFFLNLTGA